MIKVSNSSASALQISVSVGARSVTMLVMGSRWRRWIASRRAASDVRPEPWWAEQWYLAAPIVVVVVATGGAVAMWLLGVWSRIPADVPDPSGLRLERIKTGLTVAAGLAAGVTLLMALRRQLWNERAQRFAEREALEQRTTTLYVAAAEQLGSDKAAVRLAGLYALERLGQDSPKLRQTVVDVICAYLRMPYTPPADVLRWNADASPCVLREDDPDPDSSEQPARRQELEVRLTAQRLLLAHTQVPGGRDEPITYWRTPTGARMDLDLTGSTLVSFNLDFCQVGVVRLDFAQLHRVTHLSPVQFHGYTSWAWAEFHGDALLVSVQFHGVADLHGAQFYGKTYLMDAQFHDEANLADAQFHGHIDLAGMRATERAILPHAWSLASDDGKPLRPVRLDEGVRSNVDNRRRRRKTGRS